MQKELKPQLPRKGVLKRIVICTLVLGLGLSGMLLLVSLKKPPVEVVRQEPALRVKVRPGRWGSPAPGGRRGDTGRCGALSN